jgi:hypothetical protein
MSNRVPAPKPTNIHRVRALNSWRLKHKQAVGFVVTDGDQIVGHIPHLFEGSRFWRPGWEAYDNQGELHAQVNQRGQWVETKRAVA